MEHHLRRIISNMAIRTSHFRYYLRCLEGSVSSVSAGWRPYLRSRVINKTYEIVIPNQEHRFLFRVTLPVDLFFKAESEVATLAFLRQKRIIPVPELVAWNSTATNPIGYEWILLEKVEVVPLQWELRAMPIDTKTGIAERRYAVELYALAIDKIGSLLIWGYPYTRDEE